MDDQFHRHDCTTGRDRTTDRDSTTRGDRTTDRDNTTRRDMTTRLGETTRRRLLAAVGASAAATVAGCSGLGPSEFEAEPVGLTPDGVRALGFAQPSHEELVDRRRAEVEGQGVSVTVRSQVVTYGTREPARIADWTVADPVTRAVGALSTPEAEVGGQELNPLATTPPSQLVHGDRGRDLLRRAGVGGGGAVRYRREPERVDTLQGVELLGHEATVESYAGIADGGNRPDEAFLAHLARVTEGSDVVLVFGVQRRYISDHADEPPPLNEGYSTRNLEVAWELLTSIRRYIVHDPLLEIDFSNVEAVGSGFAFGPLLFVPRGFNYIMHRELDSGVLWHDTFNPARYDPAAIQADLDVISGHEFDLLRVFIDQRAGDPGIIDDHGDTEFSTDYVDNVVDFLRRARDANVFVVLTFPGIPPRPDRPADGSLERPIEAGNRTYLVQEFIDAKASYLRDFLRTLFDREADLESALFAVELENETHVQTDRLPFSDRTGTVTTATGDTYDRTSHADLQRMIDENVTRWANTCTAAVREVATDTLVSANVFPYQAAGLDGPGDLDPRGDFTVVPANPLVLARTDIDYLDIHVYMGSPGTLESNLESIDYPTVKAALEERDMALLLGEFGALTYNYRDLEHAATEVREQWEYLRDRGFQGFTYWPYQDNLQEDRYAATDGPGDGTIFETLTDA